MEVGQASRGGKTAVPAFNAQAFLDSSGMAQTVEYRRGETIFTQGDTCEYNGEHPFKISSSLLSVVLYD